MDTKKTVLIVEDEQLLREALQEAFTAEGFTALEANNGEEGLAVAKDKHPDIILLDIIMPKMDGQEMLKALREDEWGKTAPVIVLTNLSDYHSVAEALGKGVHDFLVKSDWEISDVVKTVKQKLNIA